MSKKAQITKVTETTTEHLTTTQGIEIKVATKVCGKCKRELPAKDFWGSRSSKDGLQGACKDCQLETPLGSHTTDLTKVVKETRLTTCEESPKKVRKSRAHPIGSGKRKECAKCKFRISAKNIRVGKDGKCMNKNAIADKKNQAKTCPYKE
jgi:predicted SprT family Zn-dependent metalloprotease